MCFNYKEKGHPRSLSGLGCPLAELGGGQGGVAPTTRSIPSPDQQAMEPRAAPHQPPSGGDTSTSRGWVEGGEKNAESDLDKESRGELWSTLGLFLTLVYLKNKKPKKKKKGKKTNFIYKVKLKPRINGKRQDLWGRGKAGPEPIPHSEHREPGDRCWFLLARLGQLNTVLTGRHGPHQTLASTDTAPAMAREPPPQKPAPGSWQDLCHS